MTTWTSRLPQFSRELERVVPAIRREVAELALDYIVNGSPVTGAPGQPEDLRQGQWSISETGPDTTTVGTADSSAPAVEDGISRITGGPVTLNSPIGGFHSVMLTHQNAEPLIKAAVRTVKGV